VFPGPGDACLEIGCGRIGWLGDLIGWGLREEDLHGIDLDVERLEVARRALPAADLRVGSAVELPWPDASFAMVIASTLFSSILDPAARRAIAAEIMRVLRPGAALLWYDFSWNSPRNSAVRKVTRSEVRQLFPGLAGPIPRVTLAPPIARLVAPHSWVLAQLLQSIPLLRTHLLAVMVKN
jgi:ubiquinone/menaquinone biosynthesis C-methylase UbiE